MGAVAEYTSFIPVRLENLAHVAKECVCKHVVPAYVVMAKTSIVHALRCAHMRCFPRGSEFSIVGAAIDHRPLIVVELQQVRLDVKIIIIVVVDLKVRSGDRSLVGILYAACMR